jgi:hypothetical protein
MSVLEPNVRVSNDMRRGTGTLKSTGWSGDSSITSEELHVR